MIKRIALIFLSWRVFLFIPLIAGNAFITYRQGYPYTSPLYFLSDPHWFVSNFLFSSWANFDGVHYLLIGANGYTVNAGFFPLFPLLLNVASSIFGRVAAFDPLQYFVSLAFVSFCFLLSLIVLYRLIKIDYKDNIALFTIFFLLIFPTSFFYVSIYSESLFLLLSLSSFKGYYIA